MYTNSRAITADFASLKWVKNRKVLQVICEVPSERAGEVLSILGNPTGEGIPVAIAVLEIQPDVKKDLAEKVEKAKRKFEDLPYSQQAALLCKDHSFGLYLYETANDKSEMPFNGGPDAIRAALCKQLNITSRSELDDANKTTARSEFERIRNSHRGRVGSYPEQRG